MLRFPTIGYVHQKMHWLWLDEKRRTTRQKKLASALTEEQKCKDCETPTPENILLAAESKSKAQALLEELSKNPTDREVLRLRKEGYSTEEIAEKLGLTTGAVLMRVSRRGPVGLMSLSAITRRRRILARSTSPAASSGQGSACRAPRVAAGSAYFLMPASSRA